MEADIARSTSRKLGEVRPWQLFFLKGEIMYVNRIGTGPQWRPWCVSVSCCIHCGDFGHKNRVLSVNTVSFQGPSGWPKLVEQPHRIWSFLVPFFIVFNAVWDLTLYSGISYFSRSSRYLCPENNIHLALATLSLSFMWKKWLVAD